MAAARLEKADRVSIRELILGALEVLSVNEHWNDDYHRTRLTLGAGLYDLLHDRLARTTTGDVPLMWDGAPMINPMRDGRLDEELLDGVIASKPYVSSGNYINKMSDYCRGCRYDVKQKTGGEACPFNALYWDFLARHRKRFAGNPRMRMMMRNLDRIDAGELRKIRARARVSLYEARGEYQLILEHMEEAGHGALQRGEHLDKRQRGKNGDSRDSR